MVEQQQLSVAEVASRLGIKANLLYRWKAQFAADGQQAFPDSGQQTAQEAELATLRRENEQFRMERDIFKKVTVFLIVSRASLAKRFVNVDRVICPHPPCRVETWVRRCSLMPAGRHS